MIVVPVLGGVAVHLPAGHDLTQTYRPLGGRSLQRMLSGAARLRQHWSRIATTLSASGWIPDGLAGLDYSQPMILACAAPRAIAGTGASPHLIPLPAARRADVAPIGQALVAAGTVAVATPLSLDGDTATLTTVAGAVQYLAWYWPQLTVYAEPPEIEYDHDGAAWRWTLQAEEV